MTEATLQRINGLCRMASEDMAAALGRLDTLETMLRGKGHHADALLVSGAIADLESSRERYVQAREVLAHEAALEGLYVLDHAGQDAQDQARLGIEPAEEGFS